MIRLTKTHFLIALVVLGSAFFVGNALAADYPLQEKLQQCEAAFEKMHSGDLSQEEAWRTRRAHKKLVKEILTNLNMRNHSLLKSDDRTISPEEILENLVAMGSLLEMISTENLRMTDEWGYPLEQ